MTLQSVRQPLTPGFAARLGHMGFRRLSYLLLGIGQFFKCRSSRGYIVLDGVKRVEFNNILFISCHIQPSEGGGFVFAPKADGKDGLMNICVVSHSNRMKLIPLLLGAMTGRKKRYKGTRTYECREVKIHTDAPLPVHVDGEVCGNVNVYRQNVFRGSTDDVLITGSARQNFINQL